MLTAGDLLKRPAATTITIPQDPSYKLPMVYRAVPLAGLLRGRSLQPDEVIEVVASDGFVPSLPADLVFRKDDRGAVPYLAVEPADQPWPLLPGKEDSAGPGLAQSPSRRRSQRAVALY